MNNPQNTRNTKMKESHNSSTRASLAFPAVMMSLLFLLSGSAGCLDVAVIGDLLNEVDGNDDSGTVWKELLLADGKFTLDIEDPPALQDWDDMAERFFEKITDNLSDPGIDTPQHIRKALAEEGISLKKEIHTFDVPGDAEIVTLYYRVEFDSALVADEEITPGYFEMTVRRPDGSEARFLEEAVYDTDTAARTIPIGTDPGFWTVEIGGTGGLLSFYSGDYLIRVRANVEA